MKKEAKSKEQIEAENEEKRKLAKEILDWTNRIPPKILNDADQRAAKQFKLIASEARKSALADRLDLAKLRQHHVAIRPYYA
jgi:tRNA A37 N6-isopentenylltransferase MiaA